MSIWNKSLSYNNEQESWQRRSYNNCCTNREDEHLGTKILYQHTYVQLLDLFFESLDIQLAAPTFISIFFNGPPLTSSSEPQTLRLTVQCDPDKTSDPKFISYDGSRVDVEWSSPAGCPSQRDDDDDDDDKNDDKKQDDKAPNHESVGSGLGWFFLMCVIYLIRSSSSLAFTFNNSIFLSLAAYFGVGAYYNYSTYGARGADLIPWVLTIFSVTFPLCSRCLPRHRDFWKEVPYMLSDVVSHMCSNIRPRRASSRGYQPIPGV